MDEKLTETSISQTFIPQRETEMINAKTLTIEIDPQGNQDGQDSQDEQHHQHLSLSYLQCQSHQQGVKSDETPALLFLHGILGDARTWLPFLSAFPQYDCYALTLSGFGKIEPGSAEGEILFDTDRHAAEVVAFCQALNKQEGKPQRKYIVIAWSYACHVALLAADKDRSQNRSLFSELILYELIIPSYGISEEKHQQFTRDIAKMMSPIIRAFRRNEEMQAIDHFIAACKNAPFTLKEQSKHIQEIKEENRHTLNKLLTQKDPPPFSAEMLQTLNERVPITILWGKNSRAIFQLSSQAAFTALNEESTTLSKTVKGGEIDADHLLPEENPEKLILLLKELISQ